MEQITNGVTPPDAERPEITEEHVVIDLGKDNAAMLTQINAKLDALLKNNGIEPASLTEKE